MMNPYTEVIKEIANKGGDFIFKFWEISQGFMGDKRTFDQTVISQLLVSCQISSESAFILIINQRFWDAEILIRSVSEGTFKIGYIALANEVERPNRIDEFYNILPEINSLKRHKRIEKILSAIDNEDTILYKVYKELLLSSEESAELSAKYPKQVRQPIEHKWSFNEIIQSIATTSGADAFRHFGFGYGMESHQVHKDGDALRLLWDRSERSPGRLHSAELAHAAREVSDLVTMAILRTRMLIKMLGRDASPCKSLEEIYNNTLGVQLDELAQLWWDIEAKDGSG